jgi:hypothetical protein
VTVTATATATATAATVVPMRPRPNDKAMRRAAKAAPLAGADKVANLRLRSSLVRRVETSVTRSGLPGWFEAQLPARENRPTGGPRRVLTVEAVMVGLMLLAVAEQPLIVRDVAEVLNGLHPSTKFRLGVPRPAVAAEGVVTERMVSRLFNRMAVLVDPSPHTAANRDPYFAALGEMRQEWADALEAAGGDLGDTAVVAAAAALDSLEADHLDDLAAKLAKLRYVLDRGVEATLPDDEVHTGSYAIDSSEVASWTAPYRSQPKAPHLHPDPDARWNGKGDGWLGYWLHGVVRVGEVGGEPVACLTERIELTAANADIRPAGLELLTRMVADHKTADEAAGRTERPRRDVLADRAYTSNTEVATDWIEPLFALGFASVHELTVYQVGKTKTLSNGAIVINGQPWSPRTPAHLVAALSAPPQFPATRSQTAAYQAVVAQAAVYALHPVGGRDATHGFWDFGCRAMALLGQLRCDLKPTSLTLDIGKRPTTDPSVFTPLVAPSICGQQKSRVEADELPFWQQELYGSAEWNASWQRRNRVEGVFGNIKNEAAQTIRRGNFRVMGLAKTSLMSMFLVMAANLRLTDTFELAQKAAAADKAMAAAGKSKATRTPRRRTRQLAEMGEYISRRQAEREALDAIAGSAPATPPETVGQTLHDATAGDEQPGEPPGDTGPPAS